VLPTVANTVILYWLIDNHVIANRCCI